MHTECMHCMHCIHCMWCMRSMCICEHCMHCMHFMHCMYCMHCMHCMHRCTSLAAGVHGVCGARRIGVSACGLQCTYSAWRRVSNKFFSYLLHAANPHALYNDQAWSTGGCLQYRNYNRRDKLHKIHLLAFLLVHFERQEQRYSPQSKS